MFLFAGDWSRERGSHQPCGDVRHGGHRRHQRAERRLLHRGAVHRRRRRLRSPQGEHCFLIVLA